MCFIVTLLGLFILYFLYLPILFLVSLSYKKKRLSLNTVSPASVSVIIATYNEERVIRQKLESLLSADLPRDSYEVIVVDSGSVDNTKAIVSEYTNKGVILLEQAKRLGKANALNFALAKARGEIIVISDANSEFTPTSINTLVKNFEKGIGAVLPRFMPSGEMNLWNNVFYWFHHIYKKLESDIDSVFIVFGELFAFRKDLINKIDERVAADDLEIAMNIRKQNFKIKYAPEVVVKEKLPASRRETKTQKVRHILGIMQVMIKNFDLFFNPKYGLYGLLIFPIHFLQMTVGPFLCFMALFLFSVNVSYFAFNFFSPSSIVALFVMAVILLSILYYRSMNLRKIVLFFFDFFSLQVYAIIALIDLIKRKDAHIWEKISSTR